jgi:phosphoglycolate phosphatase-like HAD superfamily hydrolase
MTKLVIFDIDGTLLNSTEVDADCFVRSITGEFGIRNIDDRWENYKNVTDAGIFEEIFEKAFGRRPSESETRRHIERLLRLLETTYAEDPRLFREVAGARDIIEKLSNHPEWRTAIATGAWRESAVFKLKSADISVEGIPLVTGSEEKAREQLVRRCIREAERHYAPLNSPRSKVGSQKSEDDVSENRGHDATSCPRFSVPIHTAFEKIVSIGDGIWDFEAAKKAGIGFVMIDVKGKLPDSRDYATLKDFRDQELFMRRLEEASTPLPPFTKGG